MRSSGRSHDLRITLEDRRLSPVPLSRPPYEFDCFLVDMPDGSVGIDWREVREGRLRRGRLVGQRSAEDHREALDRFVALAGPAGDEEYLRFAQDFGVPTFHDRGGIRPLWV